MQDFACKDPEKMHYKVLADRARILKDSEKGVGLMSAELDKLIAEGEVRGEVRGEIRGRVEERKEFVKSLLEMGSLSKDVIAKCAKMPVEEVEALEKELNKTAH